MRRVLDPMFVYFDSGHHWVPCQGLAMLVLSDMSYFMEASGILIFFALIFFLIRSSLHLILDILCSAILNKYILCTYYIRHLLEKPFTVVAFLMLTFGSGNQKLILAYVIRHLDHKNISHDPQLKSYVVQVASALASQIRSGAVLAEIGFVSDLCRHLRKSLQATAESVGEQESNINIMLQNSIEDCLLEIARGVSSILVAFVVDAFCASIITKSLWFF